MDNETLWCSIDPANTSGIAYWKGSQLVNTTILMKVGTKGNYRLGKDKYPARFSAWMDAIKNSDTIITEEGMGGFKTAIKSQSGIRGYIEAVCDSMRDCGDSCKYTFKTVNVSEWRRVIKEAYGISWPATTERKKALSVQIVKQHFGIDVTNDESDAVLLGVAAMRMGMVD